MILEIRGLQNLNINGYSRFVQTRFIASQLKSQKK
jgi:hypothetical protein